MPRGRRKRPLRKERLSTDQGTKYEAWLSDIESVGCLHNRIVEIEAGGYREAFAKATELCTPEEFVRGVNEVGA